MCMTVFYSIPLSIFNIYKTIKTNILNFMGIILLYFIKFVIPFIDIFIEFKKILIKDIRC